MFAQSLIEYGALTGAIDRAMQTMSNLISNGGPGTFLVLGLVVLVLLFVSTRRR
jgi:hypothetical protein